MVKVDDMPLFGLLALVEFYPPTNIHLGAAHDLAGIMKLMRKVIKSRENEKKWDYRHQGTSRDQGSSLKSDDLTQKEYG